MGGGNNERNDVPPAERMARQRILTQDRAVGDSFVGLELDRPHAEAAALEVAAHRLVAAIDEVGHDESVGRRILGDEQVDPRTSGNARARRRILADDGARFAGSAGAQPLPISPVPESRETLQCQPPGWGEPWPAA